MLRVFPFAGNYNDSQEKSIIEEAQKGSRPAIERLVKQHQQFVYNVALKLAGDPEDAADITQEAFLKALTKLPQFAFKSNFRTWLYRIVMNHFLNTKRRKAEVSLHGSDQIADMCDHLSNDDEVSLTEQALKKEEIRFIRDKCMASTLLCLDRRQRTVFILGAVFRISSAEAAQHLEITPENFRKQLQRTKEDLFQFMENKCGLMNANNPCRCHKKTKGFMKEGLLDEDRVQFSSQTVHTVNSVVSEKNKALDNLIEGKYLYLFTDKPYGESIEKEVLIKQLLSDPEIRDIYQLS